MKEISVKKTYDVTPAEWKEIAAGFNEEFGKDKTPDGLRNYYVSNVTGYSYHGIAKDENGKIAGFSSITPVKYNDKNGLDFVTGLSGGTFVLKEYRNDIFVFHDIYKALRIACAKDGLKAILGVPNKNSFKYLIKLLGFKFLYNLPYYVMPVRVQNILSNPAVKLIWPVYFFLLRIYIKIIRGLSFFFNPKEINTAFEIFFSPEAYSFRFNQSYKTISSGQCRFTYKIFTEKNIRIAYLFDFRQNEKRNLGALAKAVDYITGNEKIDMIAFVGLLNLMQPLLLKLPKNNEPQQLPLTVDILVSQDDSMYAAFNKPENWNFGLMNFDVR